MSEKTLQACYNALNKVTKWRTIFSGWQLGSRAKGDAESDAVSDHREVSILLRVELSTLTNLLIQKKIFTEEEFQVAMTIEADVLDKDYERFFPGMHSSNIGMELDQNAVETMKNWRW